MSYVIKNERNEFWTGSYFGSNFERKIYKSLKDIPKEIIQYYETWILERIHYKTDTDLCYYEREEHEINPINPLIMAKVIKEL